MVQEYSVPHHIISRIFQWIYKEYYEERHCLNGQAIGIEKQV